MSSVNGQVKEVQDIMQSNLYKILQRGEDLHKLAQKSEDLKDASALFKKRAKQLKEEVNLPVLPKLQQKKDVPKEQVQELQKPLSLDYLTQIEDTDIREYENQLRDYLHEGHYQYVLDKAAQLGLIEFVRHLLNLSRYYALELDIATPLKGASFYGHLEVVEILLEHDVENERHYGKTPNIDPDSFSFYLKKIIPYTNEPLTHDDIRSAIIEAHKANHIELAKVLEAYYYRTHAIKDRHDVKKVDTFLSKLV
jgi:hypothetical protein